MKEPITRIHAQPPSECPWLVEIKERGRWHAVGARRGIVTLYAKEEDAKRSIRRRRQRGQTARLCLLAQP